MIDGKPCGLFIVFEGPEGSGKTTQSQLLGDALRKQGLDVDQTREPGGTPLGELVRRMLIDEREMRAVNPQVQALLLSAARAQHISKRIRPHLERGGVVICDRFSASMHAYQGRGFRLRLRDLEKLTSFALQGVTPDLTVLLDLEVEVGLKRSLSHVKTVWEKESAIDFHQLNFHRRVRDSYLAQAKRDKNCWLKVDALKALDDIAIEVLQRVKSEVDGRDLRRVLFAVVQPRLPLSIA